MSSHGILWYPDYTNMPQLWKRKHGANMFRIAMYSDGGGDGHIKEPELSKRSCIRLVEKCIVGRYVRHCGLGTF